MKVCEETEKCVQRMLIKSNGKLPQCRRVPDAIATAVLTCLGNSEVFSELNEHSLEFPSDEEYHIFALIKVIVKCYCKVRFHRLALEETEKVRGQNIRSKLHRTILFSNQ